MTFVCDGDFKRSSIVNVSKVYERRPIMNTNKFIFPIVLLGIVSSFFSCTDDKGNVLEDGMDRVSDNVAPEVFYHCMISNADELFAFAQRVNGGEVTLNARLMNDIDITNQEWTPIAHKAALAALRGDGNSESAYNGIFNGNGHRIVGMKINGEDNDAVGFVGMLGPSGIIQNVNFTDLDVNAGRAVAGVCAFSQGQIISCAAVSGEVSGDVDVAGVCAYNYGLIKHSFNQGVVRGEENSGGICSQNKLGLIVESENVGEVVGLHEGASGGIVCINEHYVVNCKNSGKVRAGFTDEGIGGICAQNRAYVYNCVNEGIVEGGMNSVGGICGKLYGENQAQIRNCVSSGAVQPVKKESVGAICGWASGSCELVNCYYAPETSQIVDVLGGQPANTSTMCSSVRAYLNEWVDEKGEFFITTLRGRYPIRLSTWKAENRKLTF